MTADIPSLVMEAGGEIAGKIRLQKIVYLLDQLGLNSGYEFEYHHYGPYSEELSEQATEDVIFRRLDEEPRRRHADGVPYVIYRALAPGEGDPPDRHLARETVRSALAEMQNRSGTVLELAATINWLYVQERLPDWRSEVRRRKGAKASQGRDEEALDLLRILNLPPAVDVGLRP